jgi:hypothetical protein
VDGTGKVDPMTPKCGVYVVKDLPIR